MVDWADIVRQHSPLVRRTAHRLLGNDADAADCVQEVFVSAIRAYGGKPVRNWAGLLHRLTVCRAMDTLRQRLRHNGKSSSLEEWSAVACSSGGPSQSAEQRELAGRLRQCLAQLPEAQAEVFYLVCIEELSHEQAAVYLETSPGNVRVVLHRARARLRELLALSETVS